jgi:hypothetical protein
MKASLVCLLVGLFSQMTDVKQTDTQQHSIIKSGDAVPSTTEIADDAKMAHVKPAAAQQHRTLGDAVTNTKECCWRKDDSS